MADTGEIVQIKIYSENKAVSIGERAETERLRREVQTPMSFGVNFLDECLGGLYPNDLVLLGAKQGVGKTQIAALCGMENARRGKRVMMFALEAEPDEIERRIKYQIFSDLFFRCLRKDHKDITLNYSDWRYGNFNKIFDPYEKEINEIIKEQYSKMYTFYRDGTESFTAENLNKIVLAEQDNFDLFIIDHLHYFDIEDENENRGMKKLVMAIRDLALLVGKPVLLVAHIRKVDRRMKGLVPDMDDFHGSSDITKIATKVITLAPAEGISPDSRTWFTYVKASKNRVDGSKTRFVGCVGFDGNEHRYNRKYYVGKNCYDKFEGITKFNELPYWAKSADVWPDMGS